MGFPGCEIPGPAVVWPNNKDMKLFLTSAGFSNKELIDAFIGELSKPVSKLRVFSVAYAQDLTEEFYVNESMNELKHIGFEKIDVVNINDPMKVSDFSSYDVIYVCGGNTFAILDKLRKTGLDRFIIKKIKSGVIYVGVSAGSIIAGPNIEIAGWGSEGDKNEVRLQDLSGFNLTDVAIFPHFHDELRSEVEEFKSKVVYPVQELTNNQAVLISGSDIKVIGLSY